MHGDWNIRFRTPFTRGWSTRTWDTARGLYAHFSNSILANELFDFTHSGVGDIARSSSVQPGDLIFFSDGGASDIFHAAIIIRVQDGEIFFLHNSGPEGERQASLTAHNMFIITISDGYFNRRDLF